MSETRASNDFLLLGGWDIQTDKRRTGRPNNKTNSDSKAERPSSTACFYFDSANGNNEL